MTTTTPNHESRIQRLEAQVASLTAALSALVVDTDPAPAPRRAWTPVSPATAPSVSPVSPATAPRVQAAPTRVVPAPVQDVLAIKGYVLVRTGAESTVFACIANSEGTNVYTKALVRKGEGLAWQYTKAQGKAHGSTLMGYCRTHADTHTLLAYDDVEALGTNMLADRILASV